jgi:hypothetical protein
VLGSKYAKHRCACGSRRDLQMMLAVYKCSFNNSEPTAAGLLESYTLPLQRLVTSAYCIEKKETLR